MVISDPRMYLGTCEIMVISDPRMYLGIYMRGSLVTIISDPCI